LAGGQHAGCGADRFLGVSGAAFAQSRYATDALAAEALCRAAGATLILAPGTSRWCRTLPGVAHRVGGRADTHATDLSVADDAVSIVRWYYRQRMEATFRRTQRPWVILVDPGCLSPWDGAAGTARLLVDGAADDSNIRALIPDMRGLQAAYTEIAQLFQFMRLFHMVGRCVDCGSCVSVCPMGVDLRKFLKKLDINSMRADG
jgi:electron transfer flavoprotein alpha subunit